MPLPRPVQMQADRLYPERLLRRLRRASVGHGRDPSRKSVSRLQILTCYTEMGLPHGEVQQLRDDARAPELVVELRRRSHDHVVGVRSSCSCCCSAAESEGEKHAKTKQTHHFQDSTLDSNFAMHFLRNTHTHRNPKNFYHIQKVGFSRR